MIDALGDFHFLRPLWLPALLLVPLLWWLAGRVRARPDTWRGAVSPALLRVLLEENRERSRSRLWTMTAAVTLAVVALAGPTWERIPEAVSARTDGLVVVLDVSMSMHAEDLLPSRMARARHKLADLLALRQEGLTALVAFAGDAHTVTPLTDDTRTIANLAGALDPDMMPVLGSRPAPALEMARQLYRNAGMEQGRILLITDAVERVSDVTQHAHPSFPISILGVGTPAGAPIPMRAGGRATRHLRSADGSVVEARLDEDRLDAVARACHGRYQRLTLSGRDIERLLSTPLPAPESTRDSERRFDAWRDAGFWLLLPLAALVLPAFRRTALAAAPLALAGALLVLASPQAHAGFWEREDRRAHRLLREGDAETAARVFEDREWRAVARYRSADFTGAIEDFALDPSPRGRFNLGNALTRAGRFREALAAFDAVLAEAPAHEDAAHNRALVEDILARRTSAEGNPNQAAQRDRRGEGMPSSESRQRPDPSSSGSAGDADSDEPSSGEDNPSAQYLAEDQGSVEQRRQREARAANEQWLRRIPDDPAGLLQRKFEYETRRRLRSGDYRYRQTERVW